MDQEILFKECISKINNLSAVNRTDLLVIPLMLDEQTDILFQNKQTVSKLINVQDKEINTNLFGYGLMADYLYGMTKEQTYKDCLENIYKKLRQLSRTKLNIFNDNTANSDISNIGIFLAVLPFYMRYEVLYNSKENINDIIFQLKQAEENMYDEQSGLFYTDSKNKNVDLLENTYFCLALLQAYEYSDEELFEHHKYVQNLFKKSLKGILKYCDKDKKLLKADKTVTCTNEQVASLLITYCIYKGINLYILNKDLYLNTGKSIVTNIDDKASQQTDTLFEVSYKLALFQHNKFNKQVRPQIKGGY